MTDTPQEPSREMVEAVADAINRARCIPGGLPERGIADEDSHSQEYARRLARAALRAALPLMRASEGRNDDELPPVQKIDVESYEPVDCGGCAPPVYVRKSPLDAIIAAAYARANELRRAAEYDPSNAGYATTLAEAKRWQNMADEAGGKL